MEPDDFRSYGFEVSMDATDADHGHFLRRPGPEQIQKGWTMEHWGQSRAVIDEADPSLWHPLSQRLKHLSD